MKFLLKLKHYQLFMLTWGIGASISIFSLANPRLLLQAFPLIIGLFALGTLGWMWAIVTHLHDKLPVSSPINPEYFKKAFKVPIAYVVIIAILIYTQIDGASHDFILPEGLIIFLLVVLHLASMAALFYGMAIAAKTIKSIEMGRNARFSDYIGEFFLIWFSIIGYWLLQPRINRITKA
jgi:glucan phosphoethanolaminetransferase (alkaline phosphatase superfamily)